MRRLAQATTAPADASTIPAEEPPVARPAAAKPADSASTEAAAQDEDSSVAARRVETGAPLRPPRTIGPESSAGPSSPAEGSNPVDGASSVEGYNSGSAPPDASVDRPPQAASRERCIPTATIDPRRRSPSITRSRIIDVPCNPNALPEPANTPTEASALPDRWRIVDMLGYR
jgi:hypothetical protein